MKIIRQKINKGEKINYGNLYSSFTYKDSIMYLIWKITAIQLMFKLGLAAAQYF